MLPRLISRVSTAEEPSDSAAAFTAVAQVHGKRGKGWEFAGTLL